MLDRLEALDATPSDAGSTVVLQSFDVEGVYAVWEKALERRSRDPEGAITLARTLLETVSKRILDEKLGVSEGYSDRDDLPKLYAKAAKELNLSPNQHTEEPIKAILGGVTKMVHGLGMLRNRMSDSHGRGGKLPVRPSERHAKLAVNSAGTIATFLVETFLENSIPKG